MSAHDHRGVRLRKTAATISLFLAAALGASLAGCPPTPVTPVQPPASPTSVFVRGLVFASVPVRPNKDERGSNEDIYLPEILVTLENTASSAVLGPKKTDLSGRFDFRGVPPGQYKLCWKGRGFVPACRKDFVSVKDKPFRVEPLQIEIEKKEGQAAIFGHVELADGSSPRTLDPEAGIHVFAKVRATSVASHKQVAEVPVNNAGDYLLPSVPIEDLHVEAQVEKASLTHGVIKPALSPALPRRISFRLPNHKPVLEPSVAWSGGKSVQTSAPGSVVELTARARDEDGDPLQYQWILGPGAGSLSDEKSEKTKWKLGDEANPEVRVVVSDGKGGYASRSLAVDTGTKGIQFSGRVVDDRDAPLAGAEVEVAKKTVTTNAAGYFSVFVGPEDRYVVNARKQGYALASKIYDHGVTAAVYRLQRATTSTLDPTTKIEVTDSLGAECRGSLGDRLKNQSIGKLLGRAEVQDGAHHVVPRPTDNGLEQLARSLASRPRCPRGASLSIPAGSLVDSAGNPPPAGAKVDVSLATVDLRAPDGMPGDETVSDAGGDKSMESYGAAFIEVWSGGKKYQPKKGATLTIPVDPAQLAAGGMPSEIELLVYDERKGKWLQDDKMKLVGDTYVATVKHFSTFNADTLKQNQACVKLLTAGLPPSFDLEVTIPQSSGAPRVITRTMDNTGLHAAAIYNLPLNTYISIVPIGPISDPTTTGGTTTGPLGVYFVNTGPDPQQPVSPNQPVAPYDACRRVVDLHTPPGTPPEPGHDAFLQGLYTFTATDLDETSTSLTLKDAVHASTEAYYLAIDPQGRRDTLAHFVHQNGFDDAAIPEIHAIYANSADLGFGRDMHCKRRTASDGGTDVACYVTNHGAYGTNDVSDFQAAVDGVTPAGTVKATVGMEYTRIEDPAGPGGFSAVGRVMKFYVWVHQIQNGLEVTNRALQADLDGHGARPVPQLCMVCHGGAYPTGVSGPITGGGGPGSTPVFTDAASANLGSMFLAFDLASFTFSDGYDPAYDKATQQAAFKALNEQIVTLQTTPAIQEMVAKMYEGGSATQREYFTVDGWRNATSDAAAAPDPTVQTTYSHVIGTSCRMCHSAQPPTGPLGRHIDFARAADFIPQATTVDQLACQAHLMPHALATYNRFWLSVNPNLPGALKLFGDAEVPSVPPLSRFTQCGIPVVETPLPGLPVFDSSPGVSGVDLIFDANCTGSACHSGGGTVLPQIAHFGIGGYSEMVNHPSLQLATMDRVEPGNLNHSYLWQKLNNQQVAVGGSGTRMPPFGALTSGDFTAIQAWIAAGAPQH